MFSIYVVMMMIEVMETVEEGSNARGKRLTGVRYLDNQEKLSGTEVGLHKSIGSLNEYVKMYA